MFNALVMSYTRLPMAMAEDGMLPRVVARRNSRGVPWVSVLLCGLAWALALKLPFERLISIDLILYGSSLLLEFVALVVLRMREPELRAALQGRQHCLCLPAGRRARSSDRLCALCLARRKAHRSPTPGSARFSHCSCTVVGLLGPLLYWLTAGQFARRKALLQVTQSRRRARHSGALKLRCV